MTDSKTDTPAAQKLVGNQSIAMEHAFQHNIYVKKMTFNKGGLIYRGHHHDYDHVTLVAAGRALVKFKEVPEAGLPAEERVYDGVSMFVTRAFREHEITALDDNTVVCCIHAIRSKNGEVIDPPSELTDRQLTNFSQLSGALKGIQLAPFAFSADAAKMEQLISNAKEEGTLHVGSADQLL